MAGTTTEYLIRIKADVATIERAKLAIQQLGGTMTHLDDVSTKTAKSTRHLGSAIAHVASRAAYTIPLWLALRSAYMGVLTTIRSGAQYWVDYDRALSRAQVVTHSTAISMKQSMEILESSARELSKETGDSMAEVINAYYEFGTVGLDFQESMAGMREASRAAIAMHGDTTSIAKTLALAYKHLGGSIDSVSTKEDKMKLMVAQILALYRDNAFTLNDFDQSIQKNISTAKSMNLTWAEMIALLGALNTAGIKAGRAGTLLRTTFTKLAQNADKLDEVLGLKVNPNIERKFDILLKVLKELDKLSGQGNFSKIENVFKEIFGGVRGSEPIRALFATPEVFLGNIQKILTSDSTQLIEDYNTQVEENVDRFSKQVDRFTNLRKQLGESFVKEVVGGNEFVDSLKRINNIMESMANNMDRIVSVLKVPAFLLLMKMLPKLGRLLPNTPAGAGTFALAYDFLFPKEAGGSKAPFTYTKDLLDKGLVGKEQLLQDLEANKKYLKQLQQDLQKQKLELPQLKTQDFSRSFNKSDYRNMVRKGLSITSGLDIKEKIPEGDVYDEELKKLQRYTITKKEISRINEQILLLEKATGKEIDKNSSKQKDNLEGKKQELDYVFRLDSKIKDELDKLEKKSFIIKMTADGYSKQQVALATLKNTISDVVKDVKEYAVQYDKSTESINEQNFLTLALSQNWTELGTLIEKATGNQKHLLEILKEVYNYTNTINKVQSEGLKKFRNIISSSFEDLFTSGDLETSFNNFLDKIHKATAKNLSQGITRALSQSAIGKELGSGFSNFMSALSGESGIGIEMMRAADYHKNGLNQVLTNHVERMAQILQVPIDVNGSSGGGAVAPKTPGFLQYASAGFFGGLSGYGANRGGAGWQQGLGTGLGAVGGIMSLIPGMQPFGALLTGASMLLGLFKSPHTERTTEIQEQNNTFQITSRIDTTNKELQVANRKLDAIQQIFTYIFPSSTYFGEKSNIEDNFSINARRGF